MTDTDREALGKLVRETWVSWCAERRTQGFDVRPHHFDSWEEMPEEVREVDRRIGEAVKKATREALAEELLAVSRGEREAPLVGCEHAAEAWRFIPQWLARNVVRQR